MAYTSSRHLSTDWEENAGLAKSSNCAFPEFLRSRRADCVVASNTVNLSLRWRSKSGEIRILLPSIKPSLLLLPHLHLNLNPIPILVPAKTTRSHNTNSVSFINNTANNKNTTITIPPLLPISMMDPFRLYLCNRRMGMGRRRKRIVCISTSRGRR